MLYVWGTGELSPDPSTAVRALLGQAFSRLTGEPMPELQKAPGGKPYWPASPWHFSLSHTRQGVFCAISDAPVGLDAEHLRTLRPEVIARVLSPAELRCFDGSPECFLRFWTLKEAYVKYTGEGLMGYPNKLSFTLDDEKSASLSGSALCFQTIRYENWILSTCTPKPEALHLQWLS